MIVSDVTLLFYQEPVKASVAVEMRAKRRGTGPTIHRYFINLSELILATL